MTKFTDSSLKFPVKPLSLLIFWFSYENFILLVIPSESGESVQTVAGVQSHVRGRLGSAHNIRKRAFGIKTLVDL